MKNETAKRLIALIPGMTVNEYQSNPPAYQCEWFSFKSPLCDTPTQALVKLFGGKA